MNTTVSNILLNGMKHEEKVLVEMLGKKNISVSNINDYLNEIKAIYGEIFYNKMKVSTDLALKGVM